MFSYRHYVPVLRSKDAEWSALASLPDAVRQSLTPILELTPGALLAKPQRAKKNGRSTAEYAFRMFLDRVQQEAARGRVFVDLGLLGDRAIVGNETSWRYLGRALALPAQGIVPVISVPTAGSTIQDVLELIARLGCGACLRVPAAVIARADVATVVQKVVEGLGLRPEQVDLVVDLELEPRRFSHNELRATLPNVSRWRSWTVLAGVFPRNLMEFKPDRLEHRVRREEWQVWLEQVSSVNDVRRPAFGDYTIQYGVFVESPKIQGSLSVRYTLDEDWLILRGRQVNKEEGLGYEQFRGHARYLCRRPVYFGEQFSAGDQFIASKLAPDATTGNGPQWLEAGINHHLTTVVAQLVAGDFSSADARALGSRPD